MPDSPRAIRHQFRASSFAVVRLEDINEIADLKADLIACYKPVNSQELFAIERIALAQQMILRGARLEAGLFTSALDEALGGADRPIQPMCEDLIGNGDIKITRAQNRNYAAGEGFRRLAKESNVWSLLFRYQAQAERQYRRAIEEFERLKSLRPELPNQPDIQTQPESPEDIAPPSELNPLIQREDLLQPEDPSPASVHVPQALPPVEEQSESAKDATRAAVLRDEKSAKDATRAAVLRERKKRKSPPRTEAATGTCLSGPVTAPGSRGTPATSRRGVLERSRWGFDAVAGQACQA